MSQGSRTCQNCSVTFAIEPDDFGFYEKMQVPPPTWCPECRLVRRTIFRNGRNMYRRTCDLCKRGIIASYPADAPFPVYCQKCWWSDAWDPLAYGREFDFSRPFFEQFRELSSQVPALALQNDDGIGSTNCEYTYDWAFSKNVYLGVCGWYVENGLYLYFANYDKDIMDCWGVDNSQVVYELVNCDRCYNSRYCTLCFDSVDCTFGYDLTGCSNCTMCVGLRSKKYCILNEQYTKEEYERRVREMGLERRSNLERYAELFKEFALKFPRKFAYNLKTLNSTGDYLLETKMSRDCFYVRGPTENSRYIVANDRAKESYDCNNTGNPELCYESVTPDNSRGNKFTIFCWKCTDAEYSNNCHSCVSVFGSTGLKHASYAILNKRYGKEEFIELRERIIAHMKETGEWGEFFPASLSPFAYNETDAFEWIPASKEEIVRRGYLWKEKEEKRYPVTRNPGDLPETIAEVSDDIVNEIIGCLHAGSCEEQCATAFKIVPAELQLYRRLKVPLPVLCPNCRHYARMGRRNLPKLWRRRCMCGGVGNVGGVVNGENVRDGGRNDISNTQRGNVYTNTTSHSHGSDPCPNEFETSYAPERPEIVYCEQCYQAEVA